MHESELESQRDLIRYCGKLLELTLQLKRVYARGYMGNRQTAVVSCGALLQRIVSRIRSDELLPRNSSLTAINLHTYKYTYDHSRTHVRA